MSLGRKTITVSVVIIAIVFAILFSLAGEDRATQNKAAFHVTLASPDMYKNGTYTEKVILNAGEYTFRFVPNGDSPKVLSISVRGEMLEFSEDFILNGTLHQTGISEYYTWDYAGIKSFESPSRGEFLVEINPNGNIIGPVSVDILEKDGADP